MFLDLAHTKLDVFKVTRIFVLSCYKITQTFSPDERFGMIQQIRRAALSAHLNVAEGCSRKSLAERKRFYEVARGSIIEIDAAIGIAVDLQYTSAENLKEFGELLVRSFQLISKMIA